MEKFKCVKKHYGKNEEVVAYDLMNEYGAIQTYDKDIVKNSIKKKQIEVTNLQISTDGRLVDKAVKLEKTPRNQDIERVLVNAYERAYKELMRNEAIEFVRQINKNGQLESEFCGGIYKELKKANLDTKLDAIQIAQGFENYIKQKHNCYPLKLSVRCKAGNNFHVILYDLNYMYCNVLEIWEEIIRTNPEIYLDEKNYEIVGESLDPSQPKPIYLVGIGNEEDGENRDGAIIKFKGDVKELSKKVPYLIIHKGTSKSKQYKNILVSIGLTIGLRSNHIIIDENNNITKQAGASDEDYPTLQKGFSKLIYDTLGKRFYKTSLGKMFLMFKK